MCLVPLPEDARKNKRGSYAMDREVMRRIRGRAATTADSVPKTRWNLYRSTAIHRTLDPYSRTLCDDNLLNLEYCSFGTDADTTPTATLAYFRGCAELGRILCRIGIEQTTVMAARPNARCHRAASSRREHFQANPPPGRRGVTRQFLP